MNTSAQHAVCAHTYTLVNNSNVTTSFHAIDDAEFWKLHPSNPSWPIIAGNLLPHTCHTENMSNALGNNPRLQHTENRRLNVGLIGFGLSGIAWDACVGSDSVSRYCREASVIGKCCPSRNPALFNKQCPLKKFKIYRRRNTDSCYHQCSRTSWNDSRFQRTFFLLQLI